ncbi:phosphotransferase [Herbaspirillum seropedicae]|uniref:phosphotransferase n=1 Tax=Herbaspirillum seropedicae TaxID=964 RepID=UPI003FCC40A2
MLSKLRCADAEIHSIAAYDRNEVMRALTDLFGTDLAELRPVTKGTLSICFEGTLHGSPRFFKTHAVPSGRETIGREAAFLKVTAPDRVEPRLAHTGEGTSSRVWLHTKHLESCWQLTPPAVRDLIAGYEPNLHISALLADQVPSGHNIHMLLSEAESATVFMSEKNLLSSTVLGAARASIECVKSVCVGRPLQLCHGDLGPANIMTDGDVPVALDWEDAFWGIPGYDYLYWLTFFGNRKWLTRDSLGHTPLTRSEEIAVMTVILLLKSFISVKNNSYRHNTLTIDQRLMEVINLV